MVRCLSQRRYLLCSPFRDMIRRLRKLITATKLTAVPKINTTAVCLRELQTRSAIFPVGGSLCGIVFSFGAFVQQHLSASLLCMPPLCVSGAVFSPGGIVTVMRVCCSVSFSPRNRSSQTLLRSIYFADIARTGVSHIDSMEECVLCVLSLSVHTRGHIFPV